MFTEETVNSARAQKGVWALDTAIFGWFISQEQEYTTSLVSGDVQRKSKKRPPKNLKDTVLVLSWELFMKHLIRKVAVEGHVKVLVPIDCEVADAITNDRLEDAIGICTNAIVSVGSLTDGYIRSATLLRISVMRPARVPFRQPGTSTSWTLGYKYQSDRVHTPHIQQPTNDNMWD